MISENRLAKIYEEYLDLYDLYSVTETLTSRKSYEYMIGYFARINATDTLTNKQLAFNFLDSENRSDERLNQALNRLATSSEWMKEEMMANIEDYLAELPYMVRSQNAPSEELLMEVYEDIKNFQNMREKAMYDPEYRKAFIELFLAGTGNNQTLLKEILSPSGF